MRFEPYNHYCGSTCKYLAFCLISVISDNDLDLQSVHVNIHAPRGNSMARSWSAKLAPTSTRLATCGITTMFSSTARTRQLLFLSAVLKSVENMDTSKF